MSRTGFSALELLVALILATLVAAAVFRLTLSHQRIFREHAGRAEENAAYREALLILRSEMSGLGVDPGGPDIVAMSPTAIRYRAFRSLGFLCRPPEADSGRLTLDASWRGLRPADETVDSLLVFADGAIADTADDRWVAADLLSMRSGNECPSGRPSTTVSVGGVTAAVMARVHRGAPVRSFAMWETRSYRDGRGDWWVGMRRYAKSTGRWPAIQPVLGPVAPGGVTIEYLDRAGAVTGDPRRVALLGFRVRSRRDRTAPIRFLVALRNR